MAQRISSSKGFSSTTFDTYVPELSDNANIQNAFELFYYGNSEDGNATGDVSLHANLVDFDSRITTTTSGLSGHTGAISDVHGVGAGHAVVGTGTAQTLTSKTLNLTSNTLTGTIAQFNTALSDADFATIAGTETLTGKTLNLTSNTLTGTKAQFNAAMSDADFVTIAGTETLTNKTLTSPVVTGGTVNGGDALTVTSSELNILDGVTSTTAELNILDGVTASTAELNVLDGVTATTAELNYLDGVTSAIQTQLNANTPAGMISIHAGATAPTGWLLCDGASYGSASYATLFSVIGYTFGGSGSAFAVPNLKGRVVVGIDASQVSFDARGETGGAMTHQHAASNSGSTSAAHNHTVPALSGTAAGAGAHNHNVSGTHTHDIAHNHGHNFNPVSAGGHSHTDGNIVTNSNNAYLKVSSGSSSLNVASGQHNHGTTGNTSSAADHDHTFSGDVAANAGSSGPTSANFATSSDGSNHAHNVATVSAPTVDGGTTTAHTHTTPISDTLSNLQPYIALNYIIKI